VIGAAAAGVPFLSYYLSQPSAFWARTSEVSIFGSAHPVSSILTNTVRHALMFHWMGGTFARDNFPGLPMVDLLTGALLIAGLFVMIRRRDASARLLGCTFLLNLAAGVFSVSQEGAPYIYRTAAVIIPGFLIVGLGLQWLFDKTGTPGLVISTAVIMALNVYLYFGLEAKNAAAMRVMAYEPRLIGQEIARDNEPVWLVAADLLTQTEVQPRDGEKYAEANPAVVLPPALRKLAIINFSGRYDMHQTLAANLTTPKDLFFVAAKDIPMHGPAKIIFKSSDQEVTQAIEMSGANASPIGRSHQQTSGVSFRYIRNIFGDPLFTVASISASN
jgi:hypothetical protein